eukprot:3637153-Rhodomonas_salina.2
MIAVPQPRSTQRLERRSYPRSRCSGRVDISGLRCQTGCGSAVAVCVFSGHGSPQTGHVPKVQRE